MSNSINKREKAISADMILFIILSSLIGTKKLIIKRTPILDKWFLYKKAIVLFILVIKGGNNVFTVGKDNVLKIINNK